jgi:hypothetical protein
MQNKRRSALVSTVFILTVLLFLSPAISSLTSSTIISSTGTIQTNGYAQIAQSGSATDIQAAVDFVASQGGGNVYIPAGTFNFSEVGEPWTTVTIPAGVNLYGAENQRDANGQNVDWNTVLVMPYDVPSKTNGQPTTWFKVVGQSDPNKPTRISNLKLVGYRTVDPNSTTVHTAIHMGGGNGGGVLNFRIDHCYFLNTAGGVICAGTEVSGDTANYITKGVVDHCNFINTAGIPEPYESLTVGYGVHVTRGGGWTGTPWETDITQVLGKYTDYTVYVEDCYFERWRHCVVSRAGAHVVLRHSIIRNDFGYGSVDIHGDVPGRALEVYDNVMDSPIGWTGAMNQTVWWRAGGGVAFNNVVNDYNGFIYLSKENGDPAYQPHDIWVWGNTLGSGVNLLETGGCVLGTDYFLSEPSFYTPYAYPHPLTLEP